MRKCKKEIYMRQHASNCIGVSLIGIVTMVMMPMLLLAQSTTGSAKQARTFTAPSNTAPSSEKKENIAAKLSLNEADMQALSEVDTHIDIIKVGPNNPEHVPAGFYASYKPVSYDTIMVYEGSSEEYVVTAIHSGKEVIQGDSGSVAQEVNYRMSRFDDKGNLVTTEHHTKTNAMIVRSGFIPSQGFGSNRYRFAIKPAQFTLGANSMISASVHLMHSENIGTILCAVTNIDYKKGTFTVETSNEVPKDETINWIIVNTP
jgi:hypothetical protein